MASFMEVLQTSRRTQNFSTIAYTGSLYQATFSCRAATKEIQRVIDTINDGTLAILTRACMYVSVYVYFVTEETQERAHAN